MSVRRLFYGRHTAQHPAAVTTNKNEKFRSLKSKENIHKKETRDLYCSRLTLLSKNLSCFINVKMLTIEQEQMTGLNESFDSDYIDIIRCFNFMFNNFRSHYTDVSIHQENMSV